VPTEDRSDYGLGSTTVRNVKIFTHHTVAETNKICQQKYNVGKGKVENMSSRVYQKFN